MSTPNAWEAEARARKAAALVSVLDEAARSAGRDPSRGDEMAAWVRELPAANWARAAVLAGTRPPSEATIADVIATYERRARMPLAEVRS